jgi:hypothetical protein
MGSFLPSGGEGQEGGAERRGQDYCSLSTPILAFPLDRGKEKDVALSILVCFPIVL